MTSSHSSQSPVSTAPPFNELIADTDILISALSKKIAKGKGIHDLDIQSRKELLAKLNLLIASLEMEYKDNNQKSKKVQRLCVSTENDEQKGRIKWKMKYINKFISSIHLTNIATEGTYRFDLQATSPQRIEKEISAIREQYKTLQKNINIISSLEFGRVLSVYLTYLNVAVKGATLSYLTWGSNIFHAITQVGNTFYSISAGINSVTSLFMLSASAYQLYMVTSSENPDESKKRLLLKRIVLRSCIVILHIFSVLAFTGILAQPLSWIFIAAATLVDWVAIKWYGYRDAKASLDSFIEKNPILKLNDDFQDVASAKNALIRENTKLLNPSTQEKINNLTLFLFLQNKADKKLSEAKWGLLTVSSMTLTACGIIPVAGTFLGFAGLGLMGIDVAVSLKSSIKFYRKKYFGGTKKKQKVINETPRSVRTTTLTSAPENNLVLSSGAPQIPKTQPPQNQRIPWKLTFLGCCHRDDALQKPSQLTSAPLVSAPTQRASI